MTTGEPTAFSATGEDAIIRTLDVQQDTTASQLTSSEFEKFYEITRTADEIIKGDYKRIALQFPDELLHDSVPIYKRLKARAGEGRELYVLADTSYGSCCVDEVAAQHADAQAVVHYGHACMTRTSRLPVIYVFGHKPFNISACISNVREFFTQHTSLSDTPNKDGSPPKTILLKHDVGYTYAADDLFRELKIVLRPLEMDLLYEPVSTTATPASSIPDLASSSSNKPLGGQTPQNGSLPQVIARHDPLQEIAQDGSSTIAILYVGGESLTLTNFLMTHGHVKVIQYDPKTQTTNIASLRTNRLLMRRYAILQHARDADVFGILVGTLGVASYLPLISNLRTLLARHKKKSYTISVGKLNPAKLANFLEIECFVLVACPENSVIEAKEFLRPIVTPFELEIALQAEPSWTGQYILEFERLIANGAKLQEESSNNGRREPATEAGLENDEDADPDRPQFSLVTGKYRHAKQFGPGKEAAENLKNGSSPNSAMILRNQDGTVAKLQESAAGMFLQSRSFQGLERRIGQDAPGVLEQGRSGIARGYRDVDHKPDE